MLIKAGSDHQTRVEVPHEPGEHFDIRRLDWTQLERAKQVAQQAGMRRLQELGEVLAYLPQQRPSENGAQAATDEHDKRTILQAGIAGWSYDVQPSPDTIGQLDPVTAEWAYQEIMRFNGIGPVADPTASGASIAGSTAT
jgi:hypothetical protein